VYETLMDAGTWPAALKAALALRGLPTGEPREPVSPLPADARDRLRAMLAEVDVLLDQTAAVVS
jgi:dihydrodipicolinate synthase/N-acetylneuraminate lyase